MNLKLNRRNGIGSVFPIGLLMLIVILLSDFSSAWAQTVYKVRTKQKSQRGLELAGYVGFQLNSNFTAREGEIILKDNTNYGATIDIPLPMVHRGAKLELMYMVQPSQMKLREYPSGFTKDLFDMNTHYFQIGVLNELKQGNVVPFGVITLGAAMFDPDQKTLGNEWFFAATLGGGAKVFLSERIGFRFHGRILLPMQFSGGGLWCGTGGCNIGVGSSTTILQFDLQAGLIVAL